MKFFVIEGLDGSGKSTQVKLLAEWFAARGLPCFATRQPGDGPLGKLARAATYGEFPVERESLSLLFAAEHYQHYREKIAPALERGEYVICDRYYYSNFVYQGTNAAAVERIFSYNQAAMAAKKPDAVFFIDVPPEECMRRIAASRAEISIFETLDKLKAHRERFIALFERLSPSENIIKIDNTDNDKNMVFQQITDYIKATYIA